MLARLTGVLESVDESVALVAVEPIGQAFEVLVPSHLAADLSVRTGKPVTLWTQQYFEPQGQSGALTPRLIGFESRRERAFYRVFTTVKGVGGRRALRAMAAPAERIATAIVEDDTAFLRSLPEIGKRLAETIVAELSGKVDDMAVDRGPIAEVKPRSALSEGAAQAVEALVRLGQPRPDAERAVARAVEARPELEGADEILAAAFAG